MEFETGTTLQEHKSVSLRYSPIKHSYLADYGEFNFDSGKISNLS